MALATETPVAPFTGLTAVGSSFGSSLYHSLQIKLERRFHGGFSILGAYTYSKIMDDVTMLTPWPGDVSTPSIQDFDNRRNERAVAVFDAPHNVAISGIWELPFGHERRFASGVSRVGDAFIGGWSVAASGQFQSGRPVNFADRNIYFNGDLSKLKTDYSGDVNLPVFDTSGFYFHDAAVQTNGVDDPSKQRNDSRIKLTNN